MLPATLNDQLLAELRAATARLLVDQGPSQSRIAVALGVSQAMVSKYLTRSQPALAEPTASDVEAAARLLARAMEHPTTLAEGCVVIQLTLREPHGSTHELELPIRLTPPDDPRGKVLARLQEAARLVVNLDLRSLTPEVHINLAQALPGAGTPEDIAAFPGRFVPLPGRTHPAAPPTFGASEHLAGLMLKLLPLQPELPAICNLRYSALVAGAMERLDWEPVRLRHAEGDLEVPATTPAGDVLVDEGGFGREPALYVLGRDGRQVMERVALLAKAVSVEHQRMMDIEVEP